MIEPRIDGRIDNYKPDGQPYAETRPETVLEGVKLRGIGKDLRISQRVRVWAMLEGKYPPQDDPNAKEPLSYNLRIKARIHEGKEPELLLVDDDFPTINHVIPQSAMERGHYGMYEFGNPSPLMPEKLKFGQVIEGVSVNGDRVAFVVGMPKEDSKIPSLETLTQTPTRLDLEIEDDGKKLKAGDYRVLGHTLTDWRAWIQDAAERGIYPTPASGLEPQPY